MTADSGHLRTDRYEQMAGETAREIFPGVDLTTMSLCINLVRLTNRLVKDLEVAVYQGRGVSASGYQVLFSLRVVGETYPHVLARVAGVAPASMSSLLNTLEKSGLIRRRRDEADGRRTLVGLTPAGASLLYDLLESSNLRAQCWTGKLTPGEALMLTELVRKLLDAAPPDASGQDA